MKDPEKIKKQEAGAEEKKEKEKPKRVEKPSQQLSIVRVSGTDLNGDKPVSRAILGIKGVSWSMSNAICAAGGFDPGEKLKDFDESKIARIEEIIRDPPKFGIPAFMLNRERDVETGRDIHLTGHDLDFAVRTDVKRHIDLKTYRGWRHMLGQPVRGQRTRSKFREKGRVVGVLRKAVKIQLGEKAAPGAPGKPGAAAAPAAAAAGAAAPAKAEAPKKEAGKKESTKAEGKK